MEKERLQIAIAPDVVSMDVEYIDGVIEGQGPVFQHYRAIPCPVGLGDPYDVRKTHDDHAGCSKGFIYEYAGELSGIFTSNTKQLQLVDTGLLTGASAQVTFPRFYLDKPDEEVHCCPFDRLYLKDQSALVVTFQKLEHSATGWDRTNFPVVKVELCIDSEGLRHGLGEDFEIVDGGLRWLSPRQPAPGTTLALRYRYIPFWYVDQILHEVRVHPAVDPVTGEVKVHRMPYAVLVKREYFFEDQINDPRTVRTARSQTAPKDGAFGPR